MTRLSVNINKVALIRNARGSNYPDLIQFALDCEEFGAQGITVHPRPDQRHIRFDDIPNLKSVVQTEFNIEGYPSERFISMVLEVKPAQVTLVPDPPGVLTSNTGWNALEQFDFLRSVVKRFKQEGIRTSCFMNAEEDQIRKVAETGVDRIELYTGPYAEYYEWDKKKAVAPYVSCSKLAKDWE